MTIPIHRCTQLLLASLLLIACGGGGSSSKPTPDDDRVTTGSVQFNEQAVEGAKVSLEGIGLDVRGETCTQLGYYEQCETLNIREAADDQSSTPQVGNLVSDSAGEVRIVYDNRDVNDESLYKVSFSCNHEDDRAKARCQHLLQRDLHVVLTGEQFKAGDWQANVLTEAVFNKLAYYVIADFPSIELRRYMDTLARQLLVDDTDTTRTYQDLFDRRIALKNPELIDGLIALLSEQDTSTADLQLKIAQILAELSSPILAKDLWYADPAVEVRRPSHLRYNQENRLFLRFQQSFDFLEFGTEEPTDLVANRVGLYDNYNSALRLSNDELPPHEVSPPDVFEIVGDTAFSAIRTKNRAQLRLTDISNRASPTTIADIPVAERGQKIISMTIENDTAYLLLDNNSMAAVDINSQEVIRAAQSLPDLRGGYDARLITASGAALFVLADRPPATEGGQRSGYVYRYDISDLLQPTLQVEQFLGIYDRFLHMVAQGDWLYIGPRLHQREGIIVYNIAQPNAIALNGRLVVQTEFNSFDVDQNQVVYLDHRSNALQVMDGLGVQAPIVVGTSEPLNFGYEPYNAQIAGDRLVVAASELVVLDVQDPGVPTLLPSSVAYRQREARSRFGALSVDSNLAAVVNTDSGRVTFADISHPEGARKLGHIDLDDDSGGTYGIFDIVVRGDRAYIADTEGLKILNISSPVNPGRLGRLDIAADVEDDQVQALYVDGDRAYLSIQRGACPPFQPGGPTCPIVGEGDPEAPGSFELTVVDVTNPTAPAALGEIPINADGAWNGARHRLVAKNGFAYVSTWKGVEVYDVRRPGSYRKTAAVLEGLHTYNLRLVGDYLYFLNAGGNGLFVADIAGENAATPVIIGNYDSYDLPREIPANDEYVFSVEETLVRSIRALPPR